MTTDPTPDAKPPSRPQQLVVINAGTSDPSSTRMLAHRIAQKTLDQLATRNLAGTVSTIDLGPLAGEITHAVVSGYSRSKLLEAVELLAGADGVIVASPVYKAGLSGLFKSFVDILDNDILIAKPVVLSASAGSVRHALVVDDHMRPLIAFLRALVAPTAVFAAPEDWADPALMRRIERAAAELAAMITSGVSDMITGTAWNHYQHDPGSNARAGQNSEAIRLDTDMMRLASGGVFSPTLAQEPG